MAERAVRRIGVVCPATPLPRTSAERVSALAAARWPTVELLFHPQCFLSDGHFAGPDAARAAALVQVANDPAVDAVWFGRGGWGAARLLETVMPQLGPTARAKRWLGYSDLGALLAALDRAGFQDLAHGPLVNDVVRSGGEAAVLRALGWLIDRDPAALEPSLADGRPAVAFNAVILAMLLGTPWEPDLTGRVLLLEEVAEHHYRLDRLLFQLTSSPAVRRCAGLRLGRFVDPIANEPAFGHDEETITRGWCERSGIAYLGRADIGHDAANKVVPFGRPQLLT